MPNIYYDTLESVPDEFKAIAKETDGKMAINVVPKTTVDEFRDKNIALNKSHDELTGRVKTLSDIVGEDPEAFAKNLEEYRTTFQRVKDGELKESRAIEEATVKRTDEMRKEHDQRVQGLTKEIAARKTQFDELDTRYKRGQVASAIKDACVDAASGVEPKAIEDIISHAYGTWRVTDDGKIVPYESKDQIMYGTDGISPMAPKEWLQKMKETKPFFFKPTQGGGSGGDNTTRKIHGVDHAALAKMTPQQRLEFANSRPKRT